MCSVRNWIYGYASDPSIWLRNAEGLPKRFVFKYCLQNRWRKSIFDPKENIKLKHMYGTTAELSWVVQTKQVFTFLLFNYRHTIMDNKIMALSCVTLHIKCQISWRTRKNLVSFNLKKKEHHLFPKFRYTNITHFNTI